MDDPTARAVRDEPFPGQRLLLIAATVLTFVLVAVLVGWWQGLQEGGPKAARDDPAGRLRVVEMIERGEIPLGPDVRLPTTVSGLTADDWICSDRDIDGLTVAFPMRLGLIDRWEGYVYQSEGRLTAASADACGIDLQEVEAIGGDWFRVWAG